MGPYERPASQGSAIGALVANGVGLILCCGATFVGLILGIIGLVMVNSNPQASRICTLISWILFGVAMLFGVLWLVLIMLDVASTPDYYYY